MNIMKKTTILFLSLLFSISLFTGTVAAASLPVSSPFGWRIHPKTGEWKFHTGVDLAYDYGTAIPSIFDGIVLACGDFSDGYGNQVVVYHPQIDSYTRYAHCMSISVDYGAAVQQGQVIAYVGSTGISTGPHVHIEYIVSDGAGGYMYTDPMILWQ